jgi:hypothetical protein
VTDNDVGAADATIPVTAEAKTKIRIVIMKGFI